MLGRLVVCPILPGNQCSEVYYIVDWWISTGSLPIYTYTRSFIVCVRYWALMLQWCIQIFFFYILVQTKTSRRYAGKKSYLISTNVHLINHNNFSLIILLVLYAANIGTFFVIDWLLNFFEITFFTINGSRRHCCIHLPEIKKHILLLFEGKILNRKIDLIEILVDIVVITDKRTDVWSRYFMIRKINSGLWAVVWAGLWNRRVWADYEQLLRLVFFTFSG